jgi:hypothetical protein
MSENQEQQHQANEEHTTQATRQDPEAQPEQTPSRHDGGRKQVGRGWSLWGMTLVS